ncbi:hypothetical protein GCK72_000567 [Caenorhabditis remanei]|uniref:protein-disulfide reductase n=1 Tax=Caenorhabditis remanei TaxID=31234 RepID=A0A6A5HQ71_CAERE|nr:hypothetical protein GCK72_000567 [Caenorhabditis remanei]KAF1768754.1 hypothetical protein GCK72_000567 [Caenorhabditis remanei]
MNEANRSTRVVELFPKGHDPAVNTNDPNVAQFSVIPGIQEEIIGFIRKKLLNSIQLQQFIVEREIEFNEKYIGLLTENNTSRYNNHNDLEEECQLNLRTEERETQLETFRNRLNGLRTQLQNLGRREQKACDYLSQPVAQFSVFGCPDSETNRYKITEKSWICSVNKSISLQKIQLICEKLTEVEVEMEATFWSKEVYCLLEKLNKKEKSVAIGVIIDMADWASSLRTYLVTLLCYLLEKEDVADTVTKCFEEFIEKDNEIETVMAITRVMVSIFLHLNASGNDKQETFGLVILKGIIELCDSSELNPSHLMVLIKTIESIGSKLESVSNVKFQEVSTRIESKIHILKRSQQSRARRVLKMESPPASSPPIPEVPIPSSSSLPIPELSSTLSSARVSIRNLTIIEHMDGYDENSVNEVLAKQERERLEKEIRLRVEAEYREKEAKRIAEEEARRNLERMQLESRQRQEKEAEEARKQLKKEYRRNNPCTFLKNVQLYMHTRPNEAFNEHVFDGRIMGFYFSGAWCPGCLWFTPVLRNFYSQVEEDFEILFISADETEQQMKLYQQQYHGNWFHLPYKSQLANHFDSAFTVKKIPTLVIMKPNGVILNPDAGQEIQNCQNPKELVNRWKNS